MALTYLDLEKRPGRIGIYVLLTEWDPAVDRYQFGIKAESQTASCSDTHGGYVPIISHTLDGRVRWQICEDDDGNLLSIAHQREIRKMVAAGNAELRTLLGDWNWAFYSGDVLVSREPVRFAPSKRGRQFLVTDICVGT
ncbi:hypothetical protein [Burkholderia sp. A9]|uniref:hypothetical protein n=1 Tax=Burkholderia sp. A9 TaxID=1365108 RepID=UPI0012698AF2|nr:hypothetical protein [Burkholderia sp. A9]